LHHPQGGSKTPWAILQSCNLAGGGSLGGILLVVPCPSPARLQDCKSAQGVLEPSCGMHLAGGAMPITRKIARLEPSCGPARLQDCKIAKGVLEPSCGWWESWSNLAHGWSRRAWHHPQDASKTPWAILQYCNLAGGWSCKAIDSITLYSTLLYSTIIYSNISYYILFYPIIIYSTRM